MNKQLAFPVRPPQINTLAFGRRFPNKLAVSQNQSTDRWEVWHGIRKLKGDHATQPLAVARAFREVENVRRS